MAPKEYIEETRSISNTTSDFGFSLLLNLWNRQTANHHPLQPRKSFLSTSRGPSWDDLQDVEPYSLRQWPALANYHMVSLFHSEAWGDVCWNVWMPLFVSLIFFDKVQVIPSHDDCPHHFSTMTSSSKYTPSNWNGASEWAFLVNVCTLKVWKCHNERDFTHYNLHQRPFNTWHKLNREEEQISTKSRRSAKMIKYLHTTPSEL